MANKNKKSGLTGGEILIAALIALAGSFAIFLLVLGGGAALSAKSQESQTVEAPSAEPSYQGTLPSKTPTPAQTPSPTQSPSAEPEEPSSEPTQEQTAAPPQQTTAPTAPPTQAPTPVPTQAPSATQTTAPAQSQAPVVTVQPVQSTPIPTQAPAVSIAPTQSGGTTAHSDGTYTHDFSGGRVLATTESNNSNDPVYHTKDCSAAKRIPPENEYWYASAQAAEADGRRLCGNCAR